MWLCSFYYKAFRGSRVVVVFFSPFSIAITSFGEERAGLYASRAFVCLICSRYVLSLYSSSLCQGFAADCDRGTPWIFLLVCLSRNKYSLFDSSLGSRGKGLLLRLWKLRSLDERLPFAQVYANHRQRREAVMTS